MKTLALNLLVAIFILSSPVTAVADKIHDAIIKGDLKTVRGILADDQTAANQAVKATGNTPLHLAVEHKRYGTAELLLENKANVNAKNKQGETPLYIAAWRGEMLLLELFLKHKADTQAADKGGWTPLHTAAWNGQIKATEALLKAGAKIKATSGGYTPAHAAAWQGQTRILKLLIDAGADVNAKDANGSTPLHKAVWRAKVDAASLLIRNKADKTIKDNSNFSPLDKARSQVAAFAKLPTEETQKRQWGPGQATGKPDTLTPGDRFTAWASRTVDSQDEWLILTFAEAVKPGWLAVHENNAPGALTKVTLFTEDGKEIEAWQGKDPTAVGSPSGISKVRLKGFHKTRRVKIFLDSKKVKGWNEIDAVGLIDRKGNTQWAIQAEVSSCWSQGSNISAVPKLFSYQKILKILEPKQ